MESSTDYTTVHPEFATYPPSNFVGLSSSEFDALDSAMLIPLPEDADDGLQPIDATEIPNTKMLVKDKITAKRKFAKKFFKEIQAAVAEYERDNGEITLPPHYSESSAPTAPLIPVSDSMITKESELIGTASSVELESMQSMVPFTAQQKKKDSRDDECHKMVKFPNFDVRLNSCNKPVPLWVQLPGEDKLTLIVTPSIPIETADQSTIKKEENSSFQEENPTVVNIASPTYSSKTNVAQKSNTLYLVGIPRNKENHQQTLENHFQWCEGFKCARVSKNDSGQAKGYAFIHFLTVAHAETAMKQRCNATLSINGKVLRATFSSIALQKNKK